MRLIEVIAFVSLTLFIGFWTAFACLVVAGRRNRGKTGWFLLGLLGVIPLIILLLLPPKEYYKS